MDYTPKPTEYKNTIFRSKTEAIFAHCFQLTDILWEYEPKLLTNNGWWTPDFRIAWKNNHGSLSLWLVEIKPGAVTETYKQQLKQTYRNVKRGHELNYGIGDTDPLFLICANPFNSYEPRIIEALFDDKCDEWIWIREADWIIDRLDDAKNHRFDLK
jgi:hypothetical protein